MWRSIWYDDSRSMTAGASSSCAGGSASVKPARLEDVLLEDVRAGAVGGEFDPAPPAFY